MTGKENTTIRVAKKTAQELADMAKKGETYEDIIRRLLGDKKKEV